MEYEEIIDRHMGQNLASVIMQIIENAPDVEMITHFYRWGMITVDPDDNKFVDCAVAAGAEYIVSHDRHFNVLKDIEFPRVQVVSADQFKQLLKPDTTRSQSSS